MSVFSRFAAPLQSAIVARLGWTTLRPVQELAGMALLDGKNAVILAPTAGGKTEASIFPTLSILLEAQIQGLGAIYLAPIKALLNNQSDRLDLYTEMVGLRRFVWHGDTPAAERRRFLKDPTELLMTTPESLEVMLVSQRVDSATLFANVRVVIIDEIHALAGTDRGAHLISVLERIARLSRHDVQRIGLSATVGNPSAIVGWMQGRSTRESQIVDPPKVPSKRHLLIAYREDVGEVARDAARLTAGQKSLFFCPSRATTEEVAEKLRRNGTEIFVHHSAVSREERLLAEERFAKGANACIACTSTLELGIDVGDLDRVLQAEAPESVSSFLQRMGRTGRRAGQVANTTFFCTQPESVLQAAAIVELARRGWVEDIPLQTRLWPVLIHQLLVLSLSSSGIPAEEAWQHLSGVPDFCEIQRDEFQRLVAWMLRDQSLVLASGRLLMGPKAERLYGRKNFMELYAVFSSPQAYTVKTTAGAVLGTLNQIFVDAIAGKSKSFLLAGRAWKVLNVDHPERVVLVQPGANGTKPNWSGQNPHFVSTVISQEIRQLLLSETRPGYLDEAAWQILRSKRMDLRDTLASGGLAIDGRSLIWWNFAGGRVNHTLQHAFRALNAGIDITPDNDRLKVDGGLSIRDFEAWREQLASLDTWRDEGFLDRLSKDLPQHRLNKFQPLMPPWVEREVVAQIYLDVPGVQRLLWRRTNAGP